MLSLVRQVYAWSPWHLHPSHLLCLSLSQAAAASRASGHSRPQPPSHIEHTPSPPQLLFFFFVCFILLHPQDGPAALWLHLLSHLLQRYQACTTKREHRHALFLICLTASDISSVSPCALHMQGRLPKECKRKCMQRFCEARYQEVCLKRCLVMLS